jgi:hypothetical protein
METFWVEGDELFASSEEEAEEIAIAIERVKRALNAGVFSVPAQRALSVFLKAGMKEYHSVEWWNQVCKGLKDPEHLVWF